MVREFVVHPPAYNRGKIEVWDFIIDWGLNFIEGSIVKYVCRWRDKNGIVDLRKAIQYLKKQIAVSEEEARDAVMAFVVHPLTYTHGKIEVRDFIVDQDLNFLEGSAIKYVCRARDKNGVEDLREAIQCLEKQIAVSEEEARDAAKGVERGGAGKPV